MLKPLLGTAMLLLLPGAAQAAPGEDTVVATFTSDGTIAGPNYFGDDAQCPPGTRATGGGIAPTDPSPGDLYRVQMSMPVDAEGNPSVSGAAARGWAANVGVLPGAPPTAYRVFALCSASSDAIVQVTESAAIPYSQATLACPPRTRAVGGGAGTAGPIGNFTDYALTTSAPLDAVGTVTSTDDGDVATAWQSGVRRGPGGGDPIRHFVLCADDSDVVVEAEPLSIAGPAQGAATAACPAGRRVVAGGLGAESITEATAANYGLMTLAPLGPAGTTVGTLDGDVARSFAASEHFQGPGTEGFKAFAMCAGDPDVAPPDTIKGKGPKKRSAKRKAKFRFSSSEPGSTFECKLDRKPAFACTSPVKVKRLKRGKHVFRVTAIDAADNRDASPAVYRFKVTKKKKKRRPGRG
jgi:hypothetical protein